LAIFELVDDPVFAGLSVEQVGSAYPATDEVVVFLVADQTTLTAPNHPVVVVDVARETGCCAPGLFDTLYEQAYAPAREGVAS
jgi:hypothetical protein